LRSNAVVPILIGLLLCASTFALAQDTDNPAATPATPPDTVYDTTIVTDDVAVKVLEERIAQNDKRTTEALAAIRRELDKEARERCADKEDLQRDLDDHVWFFVIGIAAIASCLGFMGYSNIKQTVQKRVNEIADILIKQRLAEPNARIAKTLSDLNDLAERAAPVLDFWEKSQDEYKEALALAQQYKDMTAKMPEDIAAKLADFDEKLSRVKTHDEYTAEDWTNKGRSEARRGDSMAAVESYRRSISLRPEYVGYRNNLVEAMIIAGMAEEALNSTGVALDKSTMDSDKAVSLYLKWVCELLLNRDDDIVATKESLDVILERHSRPSWSFVEMDNWLDKTDMSVDKKQQIIEMANRLKKKQKPDDDDDAAAPSNN
jgi:tetratricopeptide (TPR) repeat protein